MAEFAERTMKRLFALSGNACAYPRCSLPIVDAGTVTGEICHIKARSAGGPRFDPTQTEEERHDFGNLILLCRHHHKVIDSETELYTVNALREMKAAHENAVGRQEQATDRFFASLLINDSRGIVVVANNADTVTINSPGIIQAQTVNLKVNRRAVPVSAPPGTIGADQQASRYIQHLIKRYNEFASADKTRAKKFSYGAISVNIERNFGSVWKLLPTEKFDAVCKYLQERIDKTRVAKSNAARGYRSFSSYDEFTAKWEKQV